MADYDHLLRMQGTVRRYLQGINDRFSRLSVQDLAQRPLRNMDERGLVEDYLRFHRDAEFQKLYNRELGKLEQSTPSPPSCKDEDRPAQARGKRCGRDYSVRTSTKN